MQVKYCKQNNRIRFVERQVKNLKKSESQTFMSNTKNEL